LVIQLRQKAHPFFHRRHDDLLMAKRISLSQALLGGNLVLTHLDRRKLVVQIPQGQVITPGAVKVIAGEGMPQRGNVFQKGRLFVQFEVIFPTAPELTPALTAAFTAALPPQDEAAGIDENSENAFPVTMQDSTRKEFENAKSSRDRRSEAYNAGDDDNQEDEGGGIRCQPQ
jgi:DnaJ family protein A protein 2